MMFQMTFAIITPALITGAFADRMKFSAMLWFMVLWAHLRLLPRSRTGSGAGRLARRHAARSTSPAARSCTSTPASPAWSLRSCSASGVGYGSETMAPHNLTLT